MTLTDAGQRYLEQARRILADIDEAESSAQADRATPVEARRDKRHLHRKRDACFVAAEADLAEQTGGVTAPVRKVAQGFAEGVGGEWGACHRRCTSGPAPRVSIQRATSAEVLGARNIRRRR